MAQYISFNKDVEVGKDTIQSAIDFKEEGKENRIKILEKHGIDINEKWSNQQKWLDALKEMSKDLSDDDMISIGKSTIKKAIIPPFSDIKNILLSLDTGYHLSYRLDGKKMFNMFNGKIKEGIGHYKLIDCDINNKIAIMECNTPQPSKFDEGLIISLIKKFDKNLEPEIELDLTKETRNNGGESCTFIITW